MTHVVLGLGGNVGDDSAIIARFDAVAAALEDLGAITRSSLFRTAAQGGPRQRDFINAALLIRFSDTEPTMNPAALLLRVRQLEHTLGRDRTKELRWGPRTIDIDILLYGHQTIDTEIGGNPLTVPHPRLLGRRFALEPTIELMGDAYIHPVSRRSLTSALAATLNQAVSRMGPWPASGTHPGPPSDL